MKPLAKPVITNPARVLCHTAWVLTFYELRRNRIAFIFPAFVCCFILLGSIFIKTLSISVTFLDMSLIGLYFILAMIYGLLAFSGEQDHKTLDFVISRPIPPSLILGTKYGISCLILFGWYFLFQYLFPLHWDLLPLPKGMSVHWLTLLVFVIHAISLLAGLISKGLERFFMVIVTTSGMAYLSYFIWDHLFQLLTANYYWYDIPPILMKTVTIWIPVFLTIMSLLIPLTAAMWLLRNRLPISQFKLGQFTIAIWFIVLIGLGLFKSVFAPVLHPVPTAKYGDWHESSGIIIAKAVSSNYQFHRIPDDQQIPCQLLLSKPNRKPKIIYQGNNLMYPRFSPDGQWVVFSEADELKIVHLKSGRVTTIGPGRIGTWADDSQRIIFNRLIGPNGLSLLYEYHCNNRALQPLTSQKFQIADLLWNTVQNELLIVDFDQSLHHFNLSDNTLSNTTPFEDIDKMHVIFGITRPLVRMTSDMKHLFFAYILQDSLKIYLYDLQKREFNFSQEITNFRLKPDAPILLKPDFTALLWPRIDGGFTYEGTKYYIDREHQHSHHDHIHDHDDHDLDHCNDLDHHHDHDHHDHDHH
ncbi:MAG TPA: hypothetical protein PLC07_03025 [Bacillota bacterium]|nr:hypothetical protein [Bacillota bacterium]HPT88346.1 hypothetical protein [Bacillota bacterium]